MELRLKAGAPLERIKWTGPYERPANACSLCGALFGCDDVPMRLMGQTRYAAFCDSCFSTWFEVWTPDA
jgi:hypothetical protein